MEPPALGAEQPRDASCPSKRSLVTHGMCDRNSLPRASDVALAWARAGQGQALLFLCCVAQGRCFLEYFWVWKDALEFIPSLKAHRGQPTAVRMSLLQGIAWENPVVCETDSRARVPLRAQPNVILIICFPCSFSVAASILLPAFYGNVNAFSSMLRQKISHQNKRSHPGTTVKHHFLYQSTLPKFSIDRTLSELPWD